MPNIRLKSTGSVVKLIVSAWSDIFMNLPFAISCFEYRPTKSFKIDWEFIFSISISRSPLSAALNCRCERISLIKLSAARLMVCAISVISCGSFISCIIPERPEIPPALFKTSWKKTRSRVCLLFSLLISEIAKTVNISSLWK